MASSINWDALAAISALLGSIGVIATLVYLSIEIRHNTRSVRLSTFHDAIRDMADAVDQLGHDADLTRIYYDGMQDFDGLSQEERRRFATYFTSVLRRYENILYQGRHGVLDRVALQGLTEHLRYALSQPGTRAWWSRADNLFNDDMKRFVSEVVGPAPPTPAPPSDRGDAISQPPGEDT
jgi:hypothetical protein